MTVPCLAARRGDAWLRLITLIAAGIAYLGATPAAACTLQTSITAALGTYSPAAVAAAAVPALQSRSGLSCDGQLLNLLGGAYIRATFTSQNALKLVEQDGTTKIGYILSADPGGTVRATQGATIDYMQNNLLNLLGLLGSSVADLPFYLKPSSATLPPPGIYRDKVTIGWSWFQCPGGIFVLGQCVGKDDSGTGTSVVDVTLIVTPIDAIVTMTSAVTWDPINATRNPKALPGSRRRVTVAVQNQDIVPLGSGSLNIVLPTPTGVIVALDGDGASSGAAIKMNDGNPSSALTLRYGGPADLSDDVDFSADNGQSWAFAPVAGDLASQKNVTHVRVRPQGAMAKQSSLAISIPYFLP